MWRIGVIHHGGASSHLIEHFRRALRQHGLVDGENCSVDAAGAEGRLERLPLLAEELLTREPDVLVTLGAVAALEAQRRTSTVPIVYAIVLDAFEIGLMACNVTGISTFDPYQAARQLRLLRQLVPGLKRVACVTDAEAPKGRDGLNPLLSHVLKAGASQRLGVICVALSGVKDDLHVAFECARRAGAQAMVVLEVPAVLARLSEVLRLSEAYALPTVSPYGWPDAGVVTEGTALIDAIGPLAQQVAALASGVSVGQLPARRVRAERLEVNVERAGRIGLAVPTSILKRATLRAEVGPRNMTGGSDP